jgi:cell division protein FtsQ
VSKVRRGGSKKTTRRKSNQRSAAVSAPRRLRNWAEAQVRSARYRLANAARLGAIAAAGISALIIGGLALFGQLDDVVDMAAEKTQNQMASLGFAVRAVDVTGAHGDVARQIAAATEIFDGQSIFSIDPEIVRDRVEALPLVRSATVARLWPDRIAIVVETREAYALWQNDGALNVIDREGVVMASADVMDPPELPLVVADGANSAVVEIVEALDNHPSIRDRVTGAIRVGGRRWNLRLDSGADIKLPEGDVGASIAIIATLHAQRGVLLLAAESFDLRDDGELILRAPQGRPGVEREA